MTCRELSLIKSKIIGCNVKKKSFTRKNDKNQKKKKKLTKVIIKNQYCSKSIIYIENKKYGLLGN